MYIDVIIIEVEEIVNRIPGKLAGGRKPKRRFGC